MTSIFNFDQIIISTLVTSEYSKKLLFMLITYIFTFIVKLHISIIFSILFNGTFFCDYILPVFTTVLLSVYSNNIYKYVETHRDTYYWIVDYIITNYNYQMFIKWKRITYIIVCTYILLALSFVTIDNYYLFVVTFQSIISFVICDIINTMYLLDYEDIKTKFWIKLYNWKTKYRIWRYNKPKIIDTNIIIQDYNEDKAVKLDENMSEIKSVSCERAIPIPSKPDTPPTRRRSK